MAFIDYYALLEVAPDATLEQIKQSYRRLARLYHPDVNKQAEERRIRQINEAYAILSDSAKRTMYDIQRLEYLKREVLIDFIMQQRELARRPRKRMTWTEGAAGFVRELKKEMRS